MAHPEQEQTVDTKVATAAAAASEIDAAPESKNTLLTTSWAAVVAVYQRMINALKAAWAWLISCFSAKQSDETPVNVSGNSMFQQQDDQDVDASLKIQPSI